MDATIEAGKKYPDKYFMHCAGYEQAKNVGTYFAEFYQVYYLNGLMAGALTKSNKIGYVGAHPIPEVVRHINAFALGIKEVNPQAKVHVKWLFSWYDPAKAREAAEALITEGCDALAFTEDSPSTIEVGKSHTEKGKQIYTFSHYSPMQKFGENSVVSGQLVDWGKMYEEILMRFYIGSWTNEDMLWFLKEKAVFLGGDFNQPINPKFVDILKSFSITDPILGKMNVYDLIMKRLDQFNEPTVLYDPFTGPIKDQKGNIRIKAGERADHKILWSIDWFVDNVEGKVK
jgi:simple sugar transport system substrate-binding protein